MPARPRRRPSPAGPRPLPTEAITFDGPESRTLQAAWAAADEPQGAVLVVHENRGLTDHIRSVAGRLAASGYSALAIDLLSAEGGTGSFADEGEVTAALNAVPDSRFIADMKAAIDELQRRASVDQASARSASASAAAWCGPCWPPASPGWAPPRRSTVRCRTARTSPAPRTPPCSVSTPSRTTGSTPAATRPRRRWSKAGLTHEIVTFPGADHAFFNDTGQRYNPTAAAAAYEQLTGWFATHLSLTPALSPVEPVRRGSSTSRQRPHAVRPRSAPTPGRSGPATRPAW